MKTMLEYSKLILGKVSFSRELFNKEHMKFQRILTDQERKELQRWVQKSFGQLS